MLRLLILFTMFSASAFASNTKPYWIWDLTVMPPAFRKPDFNLSATDSKQGLEFWTEEKINLEPGVLGKVVEAFTVKTPAGSIHPDQGIAAILTKIFGAPLLPPSQDPTAKVLFAAIPPYINKKGQKFGFDGFFNVYDQWLEADAVKENQHSNQENIIYLNALQALDSPYMLGVLSHEFTHLLTYGKQGTQVSLDPWLNELLGESGMQICGYFTDRGHVLSYLADTSRPVAINNYQLHYGALSLFAEFLIQKGGIESLSQLSAQGSLGLDAFQKIYSETFFSLFSDYVEWLFGDQKAELISKFDLNGLIKPKLLNFPVKLYPTSIVFIDGEVNQANLKINLVEPASEPCLKGDGNLRTHYFSRFKATAIWMEGILGCQFEIK